MAHYCNSCGNPIHNIKAPTCIRLVEAWVAGVAKTYLSIHDEKYRYYHKACFDVDERKRDGWQEESLF